MRAFVGWIVLTRLSRAMLNRGGRTYSRVPQDDAGAPPPRAVDREEEKKRRAKRLDAISNKLHAFLWVLAAALVIYATDLLDTVLASDKVNRYCAPLGQAPARCPSIRRRSARSHRLYLNISLVCLGVFVAVTVYLAVYLPYIRRITTDWNVYCPRMIPTATVFGVLGSLRCAARARAAAGAQLPEFASRVHARAMQPDAGAVASVRLLDAHRPGCGVHRLPHGLPFHPRILAVRWRGSRGEGTIMHEFVLSLRLAAATTLCSTQRCEAGGTWTARWNQT